MQILKNKRRLSLRRVVLRAPPADKKRMSIQELDAIFPYICFVYGAVMTAMLNMPLMLRLADERLPRELAQQWHSHRTLAGVCLVVGGLWILQGLWLR